MRSIGLERKNKPSAITDPKKGTGSPTGNKEKYASQQYRENLSQWTHRLQCKEGFNLTDRSLGEYISKFIEYFELNTGKKCHVRSGEKNGYGGRWKAAATNISFQKLEEESWVLHFVSFCMTGKLFSDFNVTEYLETGNESLLPNGAWEYKKIPFIVPDMVTPVTDVYKRLRELEEVVFTLQQRIREIEMKVANGIKTSISFSYLLESWVKAEAQKIQLPLDFVIADLSNRLGAGSNILELNDIIYGTYPIDKNRFKHYVMRVASLCILRKNDDQPYTGKELLKLPSGILFK